MRRTTLATIVVVAAGLIFGTPAQGVHLTTVTVDDNRFVPGEIHIRPGETVTWTLVGSNTHSVTSVDVEDPFDEDPISGDFDYTFDPRADDYEVAFFCKYHSGMTGTIFVTDDLPVVSISDRSVVEGDSGTTSLTFVVSLDIPNLDEDTVTVDWATSDDTATAGSDYTAASGEVTFAPGETSRTVTVDVTGDEDDEGDETLTVTLTNPSNATLGDDRATGTIRDDDGLDPAVPPTADAGGPYTTPEDVELTLDASASSDADGAVTSTAWDLDGDGTFETPGTNVTATFTDDGDATVTVEVTDDDGLTDTDEATVTVSDVGRVARRAGPDRVATSVAISQAHWQSSDDVLLATAFDFPDALAAGALAAALDAPLLLTARDQLAPEVEQELARLQGTTVWILGGPAAVSSEVQVRLEQLGYAVARLGGATRFATARLVALEAGPSATGEVTIALGQHAQPGRDAWPDALASGALSASPDRLPTLLTRSDVVPDETVQALQELGATTVVLLGGPAAIFPSAATQLEGLGYTVHRLEGPDRVATSVALAANAFGRHEASDVPLVFATSRNFPDGLAAGALAARLGAVLLLVPADVVPDASPLATFLSSNARRFDTGIVAGGIGVVPEALRIRLGDLITAVP